MMKVSDDLILHYVNKAFHHVCECAVLGKYLFVTLRSKAAMSHTGGGMTSCSNTTKNDFLVSCPAEKFSVSEATSQGRKFVTVKELLQQLTLS